MATGFSSDSGNSDDDGHSSLGQGLDDSDDDILSQLKSSKKSPSSKGETCTPPTSKSEKSPKPSPRNFNDSQRKAENVREKGHGSKSQSPDPIIALLQGSKSTTNKSRNMPPVPKPRSSSISSSTSPRSIEPSPCEKPKPTPRSSSLNKIKGSSGELDDLLGLSSIKSPETSTKSNLDDLLQNKKSTHKTSKSTLDNLLHSRGNSDQLKQKERSSTKVDKSHSSRNSRAKSPFTELLQSKTKTAESRTSPTLDELLAVKSSNTRLETSEQQTDRRSPTRSISPTSKSGKTSPVQKKKQRNKTDSYADSKITKTLEKDGRQSPKSSRQHSSPDILDLFDKKAVSPSSETNDERTASHTARRGKSGNESPKVKGSSNQSAKYPDVLDLFDKRSTNESAKAEKETRERSSKLKKRTISSTSETGKLSPLEKLMIGSGKTKGLLDSDSEEEVHRRQTKMTLLDALDGGSSDARKKKTKQRTLLDSDEEENHPTVKFTDRRPKGGYESDEDSDYDACQSKRLVKPSPHRPKSGLSTGTRALSIENMNMYDSSSIRDAMYATWRAQKTADLNRKKRLQKKKLEEEQRLKEVEAEEKRRDAKASFDAWKEKKKGSLTAQRKAAQEKIRKEKEEEEEKMSQTNLCEKAYSSWKQEKDGHIKEEKRMTDKLERERTVNMKDKEKEKKKESERGVARWNADKEKRLKQEAKEKREKDEDISYTREIHEVEKEENSIKAYEKWERDVEKRKIKQQKRLENSKPISHYPFKPSSNTIPFGR